MTNGNTANNVVYNNVGAGVGSSHCIRETLDVVLADATGTSDVFNLSQFCSCHLLNGVGKDFTIAGVETLNVTTSDTRRPHTPTLPTSSLPIPRPLPSPVTLTGLDLEGSTGTTITSFDDGVSGAYRRSCTAVTFASQT